MKAIYIRDLVVNAKWEGRLNKCVPAGKVVTFFANRLVVRYLVECCHAFASVTAALRQISGGYRRLVPAANSLEEALVVYYKIDIFKDEELHMALAEPCTPAAIHAATEWDSKQAASNSVMFVWEGKVVYVSPNFEHH